MSSIITTWRNRACACMAVILLAGCAVTERIKSDMAVHEAENAYAARDYVAAAEAYRRSAEAGGGYSQYMLSWMYAEGKGVKRDQAEAEQWMRKAADSGYPAANFTMGVRSLGGVGEKRNPQAAAAYMLKAAEGEDEVAMFYLGLLHVYGTGVAADAGEALRWFRMAKAHGYPVQPLLLTEEGVAAQVKAKPRAVLGDARKPQDRKALVREIQGQLNRLGYPVGKPDGVAGSKTRAAIEAFQRAQGMKVNGRTDNELLEALKRAK